MKMKKTMALLLALLLTASVSVFAFADGGDQLARIREKGTISIAMEGAWRPWTYHDDSGALTGFDVEIGALIAKGLGVAPEYMETDWSAILAGVDSGRFDIACNGVDYTEERAEKYAFSDPYVYTEIVLVVRADNETIHSIDDLAGKTTVNSPNSTYAIRAEQAGANVLYADTLGETMLLVQQGRAEATINAKGSVEEYLEEHPDANIKITATMPGDPVCVPIRKGEDSASLVEAINAILAAAREDGTLAALSEKYFHMDLTNAF